ncbi:unnamed protein product, partial [Meganyctiphanes norvegica]
MENLSSNEESSEGKKIRFYVIPEGSSFKPTKAASSSNSEPTPSIFLYSNTGSLVPAEIVVDGLSESMDEVPVTSSPVVKRENPSLIIPNGITTKSVHSLEESSSNRIVKKLKTNFSSSRTPAILSRNNASKFITATNPG